MGAALQRLPLNHLCCKFYISEIHLYRRRISALFYRSESGSTSMWTRPAVMRCFSKAAKLSSRCSMANVPTVPVKRCMQIITVMSTMPQLSITEVDLACFHSIRSLTLIWNHVKCKCFLSWPEANRQGCRLMVWK